MNTSLTMFSSILAAATNSAATPTFELGRIQSPVDWILPIGVLLVVAWFVIGMYLVDCRELGGRPATLLITLRLLALIGLLAVYVQPQWRARRDVVDRSRVLLLVDTSQSMERPGNANSAGMPPSSAADTPSTELSAPSQATNRVTSFIEDTRMQEVIAELGSGSLLTDLRKTHDVVVYRFDEEDRPVLLATLPYRPGADGKDQDKTVGDSEKSTALSAARTQLATSGILSLVGLACLGVFLARPKSKGPPRYWLAACGGLVFLGGVGLAVSTLSSQSTPSMAALLGVDAAEDPLQQAQLAAQTPTEQESTESPAWSELLVPRGSETRLGQAIYQLVQDERGSPVAGIVLFSDGQQNAGLETSVAAQAAREANIPLYTVGLGSRQPPTHVRLADFEAPVRAFPGDYFVVTAYVQASGLSGRGLSVRLRQVPLEEADGAPAAPDTGLDEVREVLIDADHSDLPVKFDVAGISVPGRYGFELSLSGAAVDPNSSEVRQRFQVEIVDRRTKVLLIAGGPSREYRFLRGLLRRDKQVSLDVWLQSSSVQTSKDDYPRNLESFPDNRDELFEYDCIVALDPDWRQLSESQAELLESWVAEEAGGLIVVPGNVYAGSAINSWIAESRLSRLRALYPVEFQGVFFQAEDIGRKWTQVQPLRLTREGIEADFLRLDDNPLENERIWSRDFAGVYGSLGVRGPKPGAAVYMHYGDPQADFSGDEPVFLAGQFYGSGRVTYLGSGELWRLREVDEAHFERIYTQLVRNVSQGRVLRGSRRGDVLLVEKTRYQLGDNVPIAAHLKDARREPLDARQVTMFFFPPGGEKAQTIELQRDPTRQGMFRGQFVVRREGEYRLELPLAESNDEPLSKVIKVTASALESEKTERNDPLLGELARSTEGQYFVGVDAVAGRGADPGVDRLLRDQTQITPVLGDRNARWEALWAQWMMFGICGLLALEWLTRRLLRLA